MDDDASADAAAAADVVVPSGESSATAAQCHYQAGRYSHAAAAFERCQELEDQRHLVPLAGEAKKGSATVDGGDGDDDIVMADDDPIEPPRIQKAESGRVELIALPSLARNADLAMCRLRSAMASGAGEPSATSDNGQTTPKSAANFWREALQTNENYRRALKGAALSLVETCTVELHIKEQHPHLMPAKENEHKSIQRAMKSTSLAVLMAGVAASHLHLHVVEGMAQRGGGNSKHEDAWGVLVDVAMTAADLMRIRTEWTAQMNDKEVDGLKRSGGTSSGIETSLCVLNETLCDSGSSAEEKERGSVALHSFRSALKAATLATDKLILPNQGDSASKNERAGKQPTKRQKVKKEEGGVQKKEDAWNVSYVHSSPVLHSRDRLVDALSFHSASIRCPNKREKFTAKRNACFEEAVKWESSARTLHDADGMETEEGCAGYAWKVRNCVLGMELASAGCNGLESEEKKKTLQSLKRLASSSSSRYACDLLGCIYAQRGDFARAHEKFQSSLEQGERNGSDVGDVEIGAGVAQRRTIMNMALCFLSMGEVATPLELLLHVWMTSSEPPLWSDVVPPTALLLTDARSELECTSSPEGEQDDTTKVQLLWKLFHASSLAQDWGTCLTTSEELPLENGCSSNLPICIGVARAFALLQCRRPGAALEITRELAVPESTSQTSKLLLAVARLYHADASLLDEQSSDSFGDETLALDCTTRALDASQSALANRGVKPRNNSLRLELLVTAYNDHGVASLMAGDSVEALRCFREAARHVSSTETNDADAALPWLLLPTYFNLSLLLLRDGHLEESAKSWLLARGHFSTWQKAVRGDNQALRDLKDLRVVAVNRHGLLMAKRSMQGDATSLDQEVISEWVPPDVEQGDVSEEATRVGGVDASQITAMDVVLLRHAVSIAEKKASSSFRRSAGHIGHH